jgi:hypothetical protein
MKLSIRIKNQIQIYSYFEKTYHIFALIFKTSATVVSKSSAISSIDNLPRCNALSMALCLVFSSASAIYITFTTSACSLFFAAVKSAELSFSKSISSATLLMPILVKLTIGCVSLCID